MRVTQGQFDLFPTIEWEDTDRLVADTLGVEAEWKLKERIYQLMQELNGMEIVGDADEVRTLLARRGFLQGKAAAFQELLDDSKEARVAQTLI